MDILFHLGAHCTDDGLLIRSILRNRALLAQEGIVVPGPGRYRELLGSVSTTLRGEPASTDTELMLIDALCDDDTATRLVLSNENFLCRPKMALGAEGLYPKAAKSAWLRECFPKHAVDFAMGLRNPATLIPALLNSLDNADGTAILNDLDLTQMSWADVVAEILEANPTSRLTLWAHEDAPYIWSDIIFELTAHDPYVTLDGGYDMIAQLLTDDGLARLKTFLSGHPDISETRRRKAVAAFLEAHPRADTIDDGPDLPGWTLETIADLSTAYEADIDTIKAMPRVTWIEP